MTSTHATHPNRSKSWGPMTHRTKRTATAITVVLVLTLFTASCSTATDPPADPSTTNSAQDWLANYDLDGLDGPAIIDRLDALPIADRPQDLIASVEPEILMLSDRAGNETSIPLPQDEFYLSLAPYIEQTHNCHYHSLTTCLGELRNEEIELTVTDDTGAVIVEETVRTYDNGFAGLWLPRDTTGTLTVTQGERAASVPISTAEGAPTCLTTLHLT